MSRTIVASRPLAQIVSTTREEPYLDLVITPHGIRVNMRSERMRRAGFTLRSDDEARALIAAIQDARNAFAAMPPTAGDLALAEVTAMCAPAAPVDLKSNPTTTRKGDPS